MSKEQVNYLLVLATLLIVWLFFNTFYVNAKKSYGPGPFTRVMSPSNMKLPNIQAVPKVPKLPKMEDLLKTSSQGNEAPAVPAGMSAASSEAPQMGETANS
jgi:hypothetical protein